VAAKLIEDDDGQLAVITRGRDRVEVQLPQKIVDEIVDRAAVAVG